MLQSLRKLDPSEPIRHELFLGHVRKLVDAQTERRLPALFVYVVVVRLDFAVVLSEDIESLVHLLFSGQLLSELSHKLEVFVLDLHQIFWGSLRLHLFS